MFEGPREPKKKQPNHFAGLVEEYHELNRRIHRIETQVEAGGPEIEEELKRERVRLKEEIDQYLSCEDVA